MNNRKLESPAPQDLVIDRPGNTTDPDPELIEPDPESAAGLPFETPGLENHQHWGINE